jgi:hypothetical protein
MNCARFHTIFVFYDLLHGKLLYFVAGERILDLHFLISLNKFIENLWGNHEWTIQREKKQHLTQDTQ